MPEWGELYVLAIITWFRICKFRLKYKYNKPCQNRRPDADCVSKLAWYLPVIIIQYASKLWGIKKNWHNYLGCIRGEVCAHKTSLAPDTLHWSPFTNLEKCIHFYVC